MNNAPAFDVLAPGYDLQFTTSLVGREQRRVTRKWLGQFLEGKNNLKILEINCGTGDDALWLANRGHQVIATDQSAAMIAQAKQKVSALQPEFLACSFDELKERFNDQRFDLIFSNFAGLNCASPEELGELSELLNFGGHLAVVIFGKYCVWETGYYLMKGRMQDAFRRRTNKEVSVKLNGTTSQSIHYYSIRRFTNFLKHLKKIEVRPVGLFIPPSYLEGAMKKNPRFFRLMLKLEESLGDFPRLSSLADHTYLLYKKALR